MNKSILTMSHEELDWLVDLCGKQIDRLYKQYDVWISYKDDCPDCRKTDAKCIHDAYNEWYGTYEYRYFFDNLTEPIAKIKEKTGSKKYLFIEKVITENDNTPEVFKIASGDGDIVFEDWILNHKNYENFTKK
jgi:hypothetical protein